MAEAEVLLGLRDLITLMRFENPCSGPNIRVLSSGEFRWVSPGTTSGNSFTNLFLRSPSLVIYGGPGNLTPQQIYARLSARCSLRCGGYDSFFCYRHVESS